MQGTDLSEFFETLLHRCDDLVEILVSCSFPFDLTLDEVEQLDLSELILCD